MGRFRDSLARRAVAILVGIGWGLGPAQPGLGQRPAAATLLEVPAHRAEALKRRFKDVLLDGRTRDWTPGWSLARDLGPAPASVLWEMLAEANALRDRLLLLAALAQAIGHSENGGLVEYAARCRDEREKTFALYCAALGPTGQHPVGDAPWAAPMGPLARGREWGVQIAGALALSRFPGVEVVLPTGWRDEPRLLAAALYAGAPPPQDLDASHLWQAQTPGADLVWRGYLLAPEPADADEPRRLHRAREIYSTQSDAFAQARRCAAAWLIRAPQSQQVLEFLAGQPAEEGLGVVLGLDARTRAALALESNRWFLPTPDPLLASVAERGRAMVIYAVHEALAAIGDVAPQWGELTGDGAAIADSVGLAVAWRLLQDGSHDREWRELPKGLDALPSSPWVAWALTGPTAEPWRREGREGSSLATPAEGTTAADPQLERGLQLAWAGRLPPAAAQRLLEGALWRRGHHPMLTLRDLHRRFVFDILVEDSADILDPAALPIANEYFLFTQDAGQRPPPRWSLDHILVRD